MFIFKHTLGDQRKHHAMRCLPQSDKIPVVPSQKSQIQKNSEAIFQTRSRFQTDPKVLTKS
jgi:hypothetical protein